MHYYYLYLLARCTVENLNDVTQYSGWGCTTAEINTQPRGSSMWKNDHQATFFFSPSKWVFFFSSSSSSSVVRKTITIVWYYYATCVLIDFYSYCRGTFICTATICAPECAKHFFFSHTISAVNLLCIAFNTPTMFKMLGGN